MYVDGIQKIYDVPYILPLLIGLAIAEIFDQVWISCRVASLAVVTLNY